MQIFVPNGSTLENQSGGIAKNVPAPINYARDGYSTDPLMLAIASTTQQEFSYPKVTTHEESGKEVFAVWSRTYAGASSTLSFDYSHDLIRRARRRRAVSICLRAAERRDRGLSHRGGRAARLRIRRERARELHVQSTSTPGR